MGGNALTQRHGANIMPSDSAVLNKIHGQQIDDHSYWFTKLGNDC